MRIGHLPQNDGSNGWSRIIPPRSPKPFLKGEKKADWLVVGAGFAGLAAARRLAVNHPDEHVILIEAGEVGENASGRNSGFGIDLPHVTGGGHDDLEGSQRYVRLARAALDHMEGVVHHHGIECQWKRAGKYHAAVTARGADEVLAPYMAELDRLKEPYRLLGKAETARALGTSYYHASVYTPGCVLMNPAALTRGLADTLPGNVALYERSPVIEYERANGVRVATPRGSAVAPRAILAVNAFAPQFGAWKGRLLPFHAQASLTRPLSDKEAQAIGAGTEWGMTPANAFVSTTMRYTQDRRLLIRYLIEYCPSQRMSESGLGRARRLHERILRQRFPDLPAVTIEHTWTGYVCLSRNHAPGFGKIESNVWSAVCQNAVGVTKGTISGLLAADLASGVDNPLIADLSSFGTPSRLPPRPFRDLGVRARLAFENFRARHEY